MCDAVHRPSVNRNHRTKKVVGHPADMGRETQVLLLVPKEQLTGLVTHQNADRADRHPGITC